MVQRHQGFRTKGVLETELLAIPELQTAASSADRALEAGWSKGSAVERLQQALNTAGFDVPITSAYDSATQQAVARFQAEHGIPFPTGRQAGPKTLSTLDDHLLGRRTPPPKKDCDKYAPGELDASLVTPGTATRSGAFGQELRLVNFAAGRGRMKPEHEREIRRLIKEFELFEPKAGYEVEFIRGFTDSVDREDKNAILREERAADVEFFLTHNGVPEAPQGTAAAEGSYDTGCDPEGRRVARAVLIRLRKKASPPPSCTLPILLGKGRGCGSETDFTHFDFPSISTESKAKLAAWAASHSAHNPLRSSVSDLDCELEMDAVLIGLAGSEGHAAFARFAAGTGGTATHGPDSPLGALAMKSPSFAATVATVKAAIQEQLVAQATSGTFDPCALSLPTTPETHFSFADGSTLKAVIGGTQGESVFLTGFSGSATKGTYSLDLRFVICDDFGVDEDDLYAPGLMPFWVLQHERSATKYAPFINEFDLTTTISGSL